MRLGISLEPGMEIGYVVKDACTWEVETEREAAGFDAEYYGKLLEKAWEEVKFVFPPSCRQESRLLRVSHVFSIINAGFTCLLFLDKL